MNFLQLLAVVALILWTCLLYLKPRRADKPPPGPYPFPIIGNLLQLGRLPHQTLAKLSQTYGPLMSLHLGSIYTVVVSSSDLAKEVFTKHDQVFSSRTIPSAVRARDHDKLSAAFLPIGPEWRRIRKLYKEHLFSRPRLSASEELRREKVQKLHDHVQKCCDDGLTVNVAEVTFITTLNLMSVTLFSTEVTDFDSSATQEFKSIIQGMFNVAESPNIADFIPILQWIDPQGVKKRSEFHFGRMLSFTKDLINKRLRSRETSLDSPKKSDVLEKLLDLVEGSEFNYTVNDIAHIFLEFIAGGAYPTASVTEWAMTELLLNPEKLSKAKQELRTAIGSDKQVQESDFSRLPYFQAVIKEVFRYRSPTPLLIPRISEQDAEINGYTIPKGTQLLVNAWAIGRDPKKWANPDSFEPERFLDDKIDFKGQDFDLLPFGAGRRICPGLPFADRMLHMIVGTLIHNFDWKLESRLKPGQVETEEEFGLSLRKATPLMATPMKIA